MNGLVAKVTLFLAMMRICFFSPVFDMYVVMGSDIADGVSYEMGV